MNVPEQLDTVARACYEAGGDCLNGLWRIKVGTSTYAVRTGYRMGEATLWVETEAGREVKGTRYRGDDLLSWLLSGHVKQPLKKISKFLAKVLDTDRGQA